MAAKKPKEIQHLGVDKDAAKKVDAMALLVAGKTIGETCDELDLDRRTLNRWTHDKAFQKEYNKLIAERKAQVMNMLRQGNMEAIKKGLVSIGGVSFESADELRKWWVDFAKTHRLIEGESTENSAHAIAVSTHTSEDYKEAKNLMENLYTGGTDGRTDDE